FRSGKVVVLEAHQLFVLEAHQLFVLEAHQLFVLEARQGCEVIQSDRTMRSCTGSSSLFSVLMEPLSFHVAAEEAKAPNHRAHQDRGQAPIRSDPETVL
ncbi:MAG: hypothetical protein K9H11_05305, partial [Rhodospirillum sp.]|nr:hypothetical protein [Rhodospirillum sp.]